MEIINLFLSLGIEGVEAFMRGYETYLAGGEMPTGSAAPVGWASAWLDEKRGLVRKTVSTDDVPMDFELMTKIMLEALPGNFTGRVGSILKRYIDEVSEQNSGARPL